jgi:hypothetical protein
MDFNSHTVSLPDGAPISDHRLRGPREITIDEGPMSSTTERAIALRGTDVSIEIVRASRGPLGPLRDIAQ